MRVDYDLVVIGDGANARELAGRASGLKARVALVTEAQVWDRDRITQIISQIQDLSSDNATVNPLNLIAQVINSQPIEEDLELLQVWGVDVILGRGEFSDRHTFKVQNKVNNRVLTSRRFVIVAPIGVSQVHEYTETGTEITFESYLREVCDRGSVPSSLIVMGGEAISCAIAQILNYLHIKITLVTAASHILAEVDVEVARILQAKLESEGIVIFTSSEVQREQNQISVNSTVAGEKFSQVLDINQILIPDRPEPLAPLHLSKAGVKLSQNQQIRVNSKLQSSNPRIYICRDRRDLDPILANALFLARTSPKLIPTQICYTRPPVAHIGLTEIAARLQYGKDLYVLSHNFEDGGICKLLCRSNGTLIGAHIIGSKAPELIETVAIAINAGLKIPQLAQYSDRLIAHMAQQFDFVKLGRDRQLRLQSWFEWLRLFNL